LKAATDEKNDSQFAKSIIYIARLSIQTDEKGIENSIERFETIIKNTDRPVKYIAASYLAELYQRYFDNYRWEISHRSEIEGNKGIDFRTWTTQQFLSTIENWYLQSLENKTAINISVDEFKAVLNKYDREATILRPTLYEVLADRAFDFFSAYDTYSGLNAVKVFRSIRMSILVSIKTFLLKLLRPKINHSQNVYRVLSLSQDITENPTPEWQ
jgi:hypothetical protein